MTEEIKPATPMTAEQKIKHMILVQLSEWSGEPIEEPITAANVDDIYDSEEEKWDAINEIRYRGIETNIPCEYSRHYESKSVAAKAPDGSWVGWTYWYGGGKHGEPEAIDWMKGAYQLECVEEEKVVTVRTFSRVGAK